MTEEVDHINSSLGENAETQQAALFVQENVIVPSGLQQQLACVDEGYDRETTGQAPIRLAGGDPGALAAIVAAAQQEGITLPEQSTLLSEYIAAKKAAFPTEQVSFAYHTDGHASVQVDEHHVDDMNCGHLNSLQNEAAAEVNQFTDGGEYIRKLVQAIIGIPKGEVEVEKVRLRQDHTHHDAQGALLVYGGGSVHSRSEDDKTTYFVVDMDRAEKYFDQIIPQMSLGVPPKSVFDAYKAQATETLKRVSTDPGKMPVYNVAFTTGAPTPQVTLSGRV